MTSDGPPLRTADGVAAAGPSRPLPWTVALLASATLLVFASIGTTLPVLPKYLKETLRCSDSTIGVLIGMPGIIAMLGRPFAGRMIGKRGARNVMMIGGCFLALGALACLLPGAVATMALGRALVGVGDACALVGAGVWLLDVVPVPRHGRALSLFGLAYWGGMTAGPLLGAEAERRAGAPAVWMIAAACATGGLLVASLTWSPPSPPRSTKRSRLLPRPVMAPGTAMAFAAAGYAVLPAFAALLLLQRGDGRTGFPLACGGAAFVGVRLLGADWPERFGSVTVTAASMAVEATGLALVAAASYLAVPVWGMFVGAVAIGGGASLIYPSLALLAVHRVNTEERANALGAFTSFWDVGMAVGAAGLGIIAQRAGYSVAFAAAAAFPLVGAVLALQLASSEGGALFHPEGTGGIGVP